MARKKSGYKRMKKLEPAVQTLTFSQIVTPAGGTQSLFLDLSQIASLVNRRFYRQGINWAVSGFKFKTGTTVGTGTAPTTLLLAKLPETWIMANSWGKGFRAWQRMNNEALSESESARPRFLDFKIYANAAHHQAGYGANLLPVSAMNTVALPGEWEPSSYRIPDTTVLGNTRDREIIAVGASYPGNGFTGKNAVSLIEGYASSRALPDVLDPNVPDDLSDADGIAPENWITALFNEGIEQSDEVLTDMRTENNLAPYPFENDGVNVDTMYPNGANQLDGLQFHDFAQITGTTIGGITSMKGGMFPCGLMELTIINSDVTEESQLIMQIDLVPGNHRGYLCEPMTEM